MITEAIEDLIMAIKESKLLWDESYKMKKAALLRWMIIRFDYTILKKFEDELEVEMMDLTLKNTMSPEEIEKQLLAK